MARERSRARTVQLDFRSGLPVYVQIVRQVAQQVAAGRLKPGTRLPTVRGLAAELGVNFNTVARAYRRLDASGVVSTQRGRGTYILEKRRSSAVKGPRRETLASLATLADQYIGEARRYHFSATAIEAMVRRQLKSEKAEN
jgi:GntR family transcriptional regulator